MSRLRWLAGVLSFAALFTGAATAQEEVKTKSVEKAVGLPECSDRNCAAPIVPYSHACQTKEVAPTCLGKLCNWWTYRPKCDCTPNDACYGPRCYPPLFSYFTTSRFNRCYKEYDCGESGNSWFSGWWCRSKCCDEKACTTSCDAKGPWTISITFPGISFSRGGACKTCESCPAPKREKVCAPATTCATCPPGKDRCLTLPRPISSVACENSSNGCPDGTCNECGPRLFSGQLWGRMKCGLSGFGLGGCGTCGTGGCHGKQCCGAPAHSPVDFEHLPILPPQNVKGCKPGCLNGATTAAPPTTTPVTMPAAEALPIPAPAK